MGHDCDQLGSWGTRPCQLPADLQVLFMTESYQTFGKGTALYAALFTDVSSSPPSSLVTDSLKGSKQPPTTVAYRVRRQHQTQPSF